MRNDEHEGGLIGHSSQIDLVRRLIGKAARSRLPVLVLGESGTGKELIARAIYAAAPCGQFVAIDCGALVGTLMESELFGHVRGAFSGAVESKKGLVELADNGTAFFDEIGDLPLEMQVKLLRLTQEAEFRAVGSLQWKKVALRIIAATHRDLKKAVADGRFRQDLYYRLNVIVIRVPALRERKEDIPLLVQHFLDSTGWRGTIGSDTLRALIQYNWPGNVRELKNCIERMVATNSGGTLLPADMPSSLQYYRDGSDLRRLSDVVETGGADLPDCRVSPPPPVISVRESERRTICHALAASSGDRSLAARALGVGRTTLYRKMKEYGLS